MHQMWGQIQKTVLIDNLEEQYKEVFIILSKEMHNCSTVYPETESSVTFK